MRILVAIANYGFKNTEYLNRLIHEYQSMPCKVDIVVLSNVSKKFEPSIKVVVGLPTNDPWSLPFGHKKLFAERLEDYDLFIYSEDDTLISWENINCFIQMTRVLPDGHISGFLRYELDSTGVKWYPDFVGPYHWLPTSVKKVKEFTVAEFSNVHAACYLLTREQLRKAINSGGYLVEPHQGRYDLLCSAATDPYTQCGLIKVICISHIAGTLVHHLSNRYVGALGINEADFNRQVVFMLSPEFEQKPQQALFAMTKYIDNIRWDKEYFGSPNHDLLSMVPRKSRRILSVGCGYPSTEMALVQYNHRVTVMPLDLIVGAIATSRGLEVTEPNFETAFYNLNGALFDCIIFSDVLQHLKDPLDILSRAGTLLAPDGELLISIPNFKYLKFLKHNFPYPLFKRWTYSKHLMQMVGKKHLEKWFRSIGFSEIHYQYAIEPQHLKRFKAPIAIGNSLLAFRLLARGRNGRSRQVEETKFSNS